MYREMPLDAVNQLRVG